MFIDGLFRCDRMEEKIPKDSKWYAIGYIQLATDVCGRFGADLKGFEFAVAVHILAVTSNPGEVVAIWT